jgi:hypothetical protein
MLLDCIDLEERLGAKFHVAIEDDRYLRSDRDVWTKVIECKHGHIYPHGSDTLGASTYYRGTIAKTLEMIPCVRVVQDGSKGINADFPASHEDRYLFTINWA